MGAGVTSRKELAVRALAVGWMTVPGVINLVALVVFATALCWRLDQIRRHGGGLQALAMTISVAALTLAFVVSSASVADTIDDWLFPGTARVALYGLLAVGVAALIVVFFFPGGKVTRERRAGVEAIPLVAALVGLQVSLYLVPVDMRNASMSQWSLQNWGYAAFYLIASTYLGYGFVACISSVGRYLTRAEGYLRRSLILLVTGLALLTAGAIVQIVFVLGGATGLWHAQWLLTTSRVFAVLGVIGFLLGICYPMLQARWHDLVFRGRRRRTAHALMPLWVLVTGAVPEVRLPEVKRLSPTALLHRRVVEIRDGLTQLSPLLPPAFDYADPEVAARMLHRAAAEYTRDPTRHGMVRVLLPATADSLDGDAAALVDVSLAVAALPSEDSGRHVAEDDSHTPPDPVRPGEP